MLHGAEGSAHRVESRATAMHSKHIQVLYYPVYCSQTWCVKHLCDYCGQEMQAKKKRLSVVSVFPRAFSSTLRVNVIWNELINIPYTTAKKKKNSYTEERLGNLRKVQKNKMKRGCSCVIYAHHTVVALNSMCLSLICSFIPKDGVCHFFKDTRLH